MKIILTLILVLNLTACSNAKVSIISSELYRNSVLEYNAKKLKLMFKKENFDNLSYRTLSGYGHKRIKGTGSVIVVTMQNDGGLHPSQFNMLSIFSQDGFISNEGQNLIDGKNNFAFFNSGSSLFGHAMNGYISYRYSEGDLIVSYKLTGKYYNLISEDNTLFGSFVLKEKSLRLKEIQ